MGTVPLMSSHITLIPTFLLFNPSIFTVTLVSISIFNGIPFFFFRSGLKLLTVSASRSLDVVITTPLNVVSFLLLLMNAGNVPLPINTSLILVTHERVNGS